MIGDLLADDSELGLRRRQGELEPVKGRSRWSATAANGRHTLYRLFPPPLDGVAHRGRPGSLGIRYTYEHSEQQWDHWGRNVKIRKSSNLELLMEADAPA